jgi:hemolysin-activating ACP:hemolysin acyltransferase
VNHRLFGEVMELVHLDPYWGHIKTSLHTNSIYYAVKHNKCLLHYDGYKLLGFCTYGFFTRSEVKQDLWDGDEVYSRQSGEVLYFPKFQCRAGPRQVLRFVRRINAHLSKTYPGISPVGYAERGYGERRKGAATFIGRHL